MKTRKLAFLAACSSFLLTSCAHAPAIDILGSFFPIWLICIVIAIVLTVLTRFLLLRTGGTLDYGPPVLIYPSLVVLFSCAVWLIFFR